MSLPTKNMIKEPVKQNQNEETINIDYDSLMNDETIQALMNQLNITTNIQTLLTNERILFLLTCTKSRYIEVEGKKYVRRAKSYQIYEHLLDCNQRFNTYRETNQSNFKGIAQEYFKFLCIVAKYVYGIVDPELIKRNYDYLQPVLDGEIYRVLNDFYNIWNIEPIIDNLNNILKQTKMTIKKQAEKRDELNQKVGESNIKEDVLQTVIPDPLPIDDNEEQNENNIEIDNDGNIIL
jgi:hypothetical protein